MAPDDKQFTRERQLTRGLTAVGFDGSVDELVQAGTILDNDPVYVSTRCTDTLVSAGAIDDTDAQWVASAGELFITSGITFEQLPDGMYIRGNDDRAPVSARVGVRQGPGHLYQMGNLLSSATPTIAEHRIHTRDINRVNATTTEQDMKRGYSDLVTFHRLGQPLEELSNWYPSPMCIDGIDYCCSEQRIMHVKAATMGDDQAADRIMSTVDPAMHKRYGRAVRNFDEQIWQQERMRVLFDTTLAKFFQNPDLAVTLINTYPRHLAEASSTDKIYGIGLSANHPDIWDPSKWLGLNLLGKALEHTRQILLANPENAQNNSSDHRPRQHGATDTLPTVEDLDITQLDQRPRVHDLAPLFHTTEQPQRPKQPPRRSLPATPTTAPTTNNGHYQHHHSQQTDQYRHAHQGHRSMSTRAEPPTRQDELDLETVRVHKHRHAARICMVSLNAPKITPEIACTHVDVPGHIMCPDDEDSRKPRRKHLSTVRRLSLCAHAERHRGHHHTRRPPPHTTTTAPKLRLHDDEHRYDMAVMNARTRTDRQVPCFTNQLCPVEKERVRAELYRYHCAFGHCSAKVLKQTVRPH